MKGDTFVYESSNQKMVLDNELIAHKLRRWEKYLENYRLPSWEDIPDLGLYMEQVIVLLKQYLDYLPPELKEEQFITAATINNYVRLKIMPEPVKKRYYRVHIAYLIIILALKSSLSIALIQKIVPIGLTEEELKALYEEYVKMHAKAGKLFTEEIRMVAGPILQHEDINQELSIEKTENLVIISALTGGFSRLLAEKILLLDNQTLKDLPEERALPH